MYFEKLIEYFNSMPDIPLIELELKLLIDPRNKYPSFIKCMDLDKAITHCKELFAIYSKFEFEQKQTINFISTGKESSVIKELHFTNNIQDKNKKKFYVKKRLHAPIYISKSNDFFKLSLSSETECQENNDYDLIRFKNRFSFFMENWNIDFTFIKNSTSKTINDIKAIKDKLFTNIDNKNIFGENSWIWNYADCIEIEFEFNNKNKLEISMFKEVLTGFEYNTGDFLKQLQSILHSNQYANTIKKILPNAIEMNKRQYFEEVLPVITDFYITDKADGLRTMLIINDNIATYNLNHIILCKNTIFSIEDTIVECEMINGIFYAFDILKYDGFNIAHKPFKERIKYLYMLANIWDKLFIKEFIHLDNPNVIRNFIKNVDKPYDIDGVIFTSANESYKYTKTYKWKDVKNMTIDFVAKKCPNVLLGLNPYIKKGGMQLYILFSGITNKEYTRFNMNKIRYYDKMFLSSLDKNYFPIQFSPSDKPNAYLFWHPSDLDNKIVELRFDKLNNEWELVRVRDDRLDDFNKKSYYGNHFKVAELIWRNYSNPLTIDHLCTNIEELSHSFYFKKHNSEEHKAVRKFNNMVKAELIQKYSSTIPSDSWVIDLGCGKGQDLHKYMSNNISNALFIDNNENNLCTVIERKYNSLYNGKNSLGIYIKNLNLLDNWKVNKASLDESIPFIQKNKNKLIVCNFAIHYFVQDIDNLIDLIDSLMPSGGRFMFTCLNGEKVYNLLKSGTEFKPWGDGIKYLIKPNFKNKIFKGGEEIEILLPFSDTLYKEYLVNLTLLEKRLKKKKIVLESQANFDIYLEKFAEYKYNLSDTDLNYIKLLYFSVYYKK